MALNLRRVVTGHDANGRAIVLSDGPANVQSMGPGGSGTVLWTTEGFPVNNDGSEDGGARELRSPGLANGSVFRVIEFAPNNPPRMHRTDTIDYAIVLKGEIDMEMDEGVFVHFEEGDVLVQRGTIHSWVNRGPEPCTMAFILIDSKPVEAGGKVLNAAGLEGLGAR